MVSETEAIDDHTEGGGHHVVTKSRKVKHAGESSGEKRLFVVGNHQLAIDYRIVPFLLLIFAHLMVLIVGIVPVYKLEHHGYIVAFSLIGMVLSLGGIILVLLDNKFGQELIPDMPMSVTMGSVLAILLFVFDYIGANFLTYNGYFDDVNAFFALWFCVYGSVLALDLDTEPMNEPLIGVDNIKGLFVASLTHAVSVIWIVASEYWDYSWYLQEYKPEQFVSLTVAIITVLAAIAVEVSEGAKEHSGKVHSFLAVCWIVVTCLVTVRGPYDQSADIWFFSAWFSFYFSIMVAGEEIVTMGSQEGAAATPPPQEKPQEEEDIDVEMDA
eukprot:Nitzschia sp. Nitz4//scaffold204_size40132//7932//9064//NITZ4_007538-RA/size40132-snap-gene-0.4-mRNA-1//-1//CDS//3329541461//418//frame0